MTKGVNIAEARYAGSKSNKQEIENSGKRPKGQANCKAVLVDEPQSQQQM